MPKTKRNNNTTGRFDHSDTSRPITSASRAVENSIPARKRVIRGSNTMAGSFDRVQPRYGETAQHTGAAKEFDAKFYGRLLTRTAPKVIGSLEEYDRIEAQFESLLDKGDSRSPEEDSLFDLLANLLEDYEKRTLPSLEPTSPVSTLKFLMDQNGLNQSDLIEYFGSQGNVSQVLSGKRGISKGAAQKLSERFKLSTDVFLKHM